MHPKWHIEWVSSNVASTASKWSLNGRRPISFAALYVFSHNHDHGCLVSKQFGHLHIHTLLYVCVEYIEGFMYSTDLFSFNHGKNYSWVYRRKNRLVCDSKKKHEFKEIFSFEIFNFHATLQDYVVSMNIFIFNSIAFPVGPILFNPCSI